MAFALFYRECMGIGKRAFGVFAYSLKWRRKPVTYIWSIATLPTETTAVCYQRAR